MKDGETPKGVDPLTGRGVTGRFGGVFRRARVVGLRARPMPDEPVIVFFRKADQSRSLK